MKLSMKIVLAILMAVSLFSTINYSYAVDATPEALSNLKTGDQTKKNNTVDSNDHLKSLMNSETDYLVEKGGEIGVYGTLIRIARDLKNLFFIIAGVYLLILVLRLILGSKTEEEVGNFKKGLIWISIGIIVTQISYYFVNILFDEKITVDLAKDFVDVILQPLIKLLETAASFFFLGIMIFTFYRMVSSNGDEEKLTKGKMSVLYAAVGFIVVKLASAIVGSVYGITKCSSIYGNNCSTDTNLQGIADIIIRVINWTNSFVGLVVVLMIIYAGFLTLASGGDEENVKKSKNIILYVAIGLLVLFMNYIILTFFLLEPTL